MLCLGKQVWILEMPDPWIFILHDDAMMHHRTITRNFECKSPSFGGIFQRQGSQKLERRCVKRQKEGKPCIIKGPAGPL